MEQINTAERKKRLVQFGVLYIGSLVVLSLTFLSIIRTRHETYPSASSSIRTFLPDERTIDSLREALSVAKNELDGRDSLVSILRAQHHLALASTPSAKSVPPPNDQPADRRLLGELQRQNAAARDSLNQLQIEKATIRQKLDETQKAADLLSEQVANLHHTTEVLQARVTESSRSVATRDASLGDGAAGINGLAAKNAALEKESLKLADQLRFAEVDCNLSRADARQVVYNDRQRQDLLSDALRILTDLSKSSDPGVQRKAKEKLTLLKNIAGMVHD